jgi:hypothetical protein
MFMQHWIVAARPAELLYPRFQIRLDVVDCYVHAGSV